jgi:hypothetical protein
LRRRAGLPWVWHLLCLIRGEGDIMKIKTNVKAGDKKGDPPIVIIIKDPVISS